MHYIALYCIIIINSLRWYTKFFDSSTNLYPAHMRPSVSGSLNVISFTVNLTKQAHFTRAKGVEWFRWQYLGQVMRSCERRETPRRLTWSHLKSIKSIISSHQSGPFLKTLQTEIQEIHRKTMKCHSNSCRYATMLRVDKNLQPSDLSVLPTEMHSLRQEYLYMPKGQGSPWLGCWDVVTCLRYLLSSKVYDFPLGTKRYSPSQPALVLGGSILLGHTTKFAFSAPWSMIHHQASSIIISQITTYKWGTVHDTFIVFI